MSVPGPKPTPTGLRVLRGNPGKRPLSPREPRPPRGAPRCPDHLAGEARKEWRRASKLLAQLGLLTAIDRAALAMYCESWGRWVEAERAMQEYGVMMKSPNGFPMQSPYLAVANKAMEQMRQLLAEFGMSPASRTRVAAVDFDAELDPLEELRRRGTR